MKLAHAAALAAAAVTAAAAVVAITTQLDRLSGNTRPAAPASSAPTTSEPAASEPAEPAALGLPERVTIPAIGVNAPLVPVGLKPDGSVQTPDFGDAAWYRPGPRPGDAGPAVLLAHVDSKAQGPDVFHRLHALKPGERVTVHYRDAATTFAVTATEQTAKTALPTDRIWNGTNKPVLRLITCGGPYDHNAGSYLDNIIVYADRLVGREVGRGPATPQ
jgi:LPXTG-site transpeptidase (sortase) family protein